jgi:hypothetical protein
MERKDVELAVAENSHLRGLFGIPGGLLAIMAALGNNSWGPFAHDWVFLAGVVVLAGVAWMIHRYYNDHFGSATPSIRYERQLVVALVIGVPAVVLGSMWLSSRASWSLDLPVNTTAIMLGLVFLLSVAASVGLRAHHVVVYGGLVVLGALPVWERGGDSGNTGLWIAGLAIMVGGLLDHRLLVRRFGPAREDDHAGA